MLSDIIGHVIIRHAAGQPAFADSTRLCARGDRPTDQERTCTAEGPLRVALDLSAVRPWFERRRRAVARLARRGHVARRCHPPDRHDYATPHVCDHALRGTIRCHRQRSDGRSLRLCQRRHVHRRPTVRTTHGHARGRLHAHAAHAAGKPRHSHRAPDRRHGTREVAEEVRRGRRRRHRDRASRSAHRTYHDPPCGRLAGGAPHGQLRVDRGLAVLRERLQRCAHALSARDGDRGWCPTR